MDRNGDIKSHISKFTGVRNRSFEFLQNRVTNFCKSGWNRRIQEELFQACNLEVLRVLDEEPELISAYLGENLGSPEYALALKELGNIFGRVKDRITRGHRLKTPQGKEPANGVPKPKRAVPSKISLGPDELIQDHHVGNGDVDLDLDLPVLLEKCPRIEREVFERLLDRRSSAEIIEELELKPHRFRVAVRRLRSIISVYCDVPIKEPNTRSKRTKEQPGVSSRRTKRGSSDSTA